MLRPRTWASEGGAGRPWTHWILKILAKKVVSLVTSGKKQILPHLASPRKILEKSPRDPSWQKSFRCLCPRTSHWSIFVNIYSLFEMQNVINLNMCRAPGD